MALILALQESSRNDLIHPTPEDLGRNLSRHEGVNIAGGLFASQRIRYPSIKIRPSLLNDAA
jgi:hypothetical protein